MPAPTERNETYRRRLLLVTDGTLPALSATLHAVDLARESGGELHALHVTTSEPDLQVEFADYDLDELQAGPVDPIEAARYLGKKAGVHVHAHEAHTSVVDSILQTAQRIDADVIVLPEPAPQVFPHIGSANVVEAAQRLSSGTPVIVAPHNAEVVDRVVDEILTEDPAAMPGAASADPDIDWKEAAAHPTFRDLMSTKLRFLVPVIIFYLVYYLGLTILAAFAPGFMAQRVIGPINVGYFLILSVYVMVWILAIAYVRVANRSFDPKVVRAADSIREQKRSTP